MSRRHTYIKTRMNWHGKASCPRGLACNGIGCQLTTGKTAKRRARAKAARSSS